MTNLLQLFKSDTAPFHAEYDLFSPLLLALIWLMFLLTGCQQESESLEQHDGPPFQIVFVGDLLLGDAAQSLLDEKGYGWPFEHISDLIEGDYAIANGEGPITAEEEPWDPDQRWSYNARPEAAQALAEVGFEAVGFSNNHAMDRGPQGIVDTLAHLETSDLAFFGAGSNRADAESPLLIETPYGIVGVVGLSENWGNDWTAAKNQAGTVPLSRESINRGFRLARDAGADWVIGYVHWGKNYAEINADQRRWAREFAQVGYDLVIGHGAHSVQPIKIIQGMPVLYSIGNFVFGTPGRFSEEFPGFGLVVTSELGPEGFDRLLISCIQTDNEIVNYQPQPCTPAQAQEVLGSLSDGLIIQDDVAVFDW